MWANLRRALLGAGALSMLAACSGSHSPAGPTGTGKQQHSSQASASSPAQPSGRPSATPPALPTSAVPTSVPPPVPGNISQTVASGTIKTLSPTDLGSAARFGKVPLRATIADAARVQAQAHIPGEIAGPALSFRLVLTNHGRASLDVSTNVAVTAHDAAGTPFTALTTSTHPVSGALRAGASTSGRYVFHLPHGMHNPVTIEVNYAATAEVARFVGPIS